MNWVYTCMHIYNMWEHVLFKYSMCAYNYVYMIKGAKCSGQDNES